LADVDLPHPREHLLGWHSNGRDDAHEAGDLLTRLQLENAELRARAVELALQIQAYRGQ
jgi:hypothetical protein